ncbi:MAG: hypothetical protein MUF06_00805, partial [Pirellulaceae bacterium]|nr:hypothetical protein [Pirellulaceae bacterium]
AANYGWRKAISWFSILVILGLGMAYTLDRPLHPHDVDPADHTHAFDIYCSPFHAGEAQLSVLFAQRLRESATPFALAPVVVLGMLCLGGIGLRVVDPRERLEAWLESRERTARESRYDVAIPAPIDVRAGGNRRTLGRGLFRLLSGAG